MKATHTFRGAGHAAVEVQCDTADYLVVTDQSGKNSAAIRLTGELRTLLKAVL